MRTRRLGRKRIGVARFLGGYHGPTDAAFDEALGDDEGGGRGAGRDQGVSGEEQLGAAEFTVLLAEFKAGLETYLKDAPAAVKVRNLGDVIFVQRQHAGGAGVLRPGSLRASRPKRALADKAYLDARATSLRLAGEGGGRHRCDAGERTSSMRSWRRQAEPAWTTDLLTGDHFLGASSTLGGGGGVSGDLGADGTGARSAGGAFDLRRQMVGGKADRDGPVPSSRARRRRGTKPEFRAISP